MFIDEIYSKYPKKLHPTKNILYNHIVEIWSMDLDDFSVYKTSNNKGFRYMFTIIDIFFVFFMGYTLKKMKKLKLSEMIFQII